MGKATFRILSTCHIGTIPRRFRRGEIYPTDDLGAADQLRRSISAQEIKDEEEAGPQETSEEASPPTQETPEEQKARLRGALMDKDITPNDNLVQLAKKYDVNWTDGARWTFNKRKRVVDDILEKIWGGEDG